MGMFIKQLYTRNKLRIIDIILLNFCLVASFYLRFEGAWVDYFYYSYPAALTIIGALVFSFSNLYDRMWQYASIGELFSIVKSSLLINVLFMTFNFFWQVSLPRSIPILNTVLLIFILGGMRFSIRLLSEYWEQKQQLADIPSSASNVLLVGAGDAGELIIRELNRHPEMEKNIVGLVDDDISKQNLQIHGVKVLGRRDDLPRLIEEYKVEEIIIAIPSAPGRVIKNIYNQVQDLDVQVKTVPGMYELLNGNIDLNQLRKVQVEDLLRRDPVDLDTESICSYLEGKTVLVTGGGGSIGSEICRQVARFNPRQIIALDIYENTTYMLQREMAKHHPEVELKPVIANVRLKDCIEEVLAEHSPEVVFHAAAYKHVPLMESYPAEAVKNNVFGTRVTARLAADYGVNRFVLISTDKAVNPTNVMGASKRTAEMVVQQLNEKSETNFMAVRFGNVLGSAGSVVPVFKRQIKEGGPVTVTHKDVKRYFMTIPEAVQLVLQAGAQGEGGEVFVLDMGEPIRIMDLARDLITLSGYRPEEDIKIEITGLRPGEKLVEEMLTDSESNKATEHERIFISTMGENIPENLDLQLQELEDVAANNQRRKIMTLLKDIVPGYHPKELQRAEAIPLKSFKPKSSNDNLRPGLDPGSTQGRPRVNPAQTPPKAESDSKDQPESGSAADGRGHFSTGTDNT